MSETSANSSIPHRQGTTTLAAAKAICGTAIHDSKERVNQSLQKLKIHEIRILGLNPGEREDPLAGFLVTVKPDKAANAVGSFYALSYACGDQTNPLYIKIHSIGDVPIGRNLASALVGIWPSPGSNTLFLWVDAICLYFDRY